MNAKSEGSKLLPGGIGDEVARIVQSIFPSRKYRYGFDVLGLLFGIFAVVYPAIDRKWYYSTPLEQFTGTVINTEVRQDSQKLESIWIFLKTDTQEVKFRSDLYPSIGDRLLSLRPTDEIAIEGEKDVLGRGHYFPHVIHRNQTVLISRDDMYSAQSALYRKCRIAGLVLIGITLLDALYVLWKFLKRKKQTPLPNTSENPYGEFEEAKTKALEKILGPMENHVGHAVIPFFVGGGLDLYYFCSSYVPGTVIASMELINSDGSGPKRNRLGAFELVMCTRHRFQADPSTDSVSVRSRESQDDLIRNRIWVNMTTVARYVQTNKVQPGDTCEIPDESGDRRYIVFDEFDTRNVPFLIEGKRFGLLLCIEIRPSEMAFARKEGTPALFSRMKEIDAYPYSDLDRKPVE
jgi:hypothetical protein